MFSTLFNSCSLIYREVLCFCLNIFKVVCSRFVVCRKGLKTSWIYFSLVFVYCFTLTTLLFVTRLIVFYYSLYLKEVGRASCHVFVCLCLIVIHFKLSWTQSVWRTIVIIYQHHPSVRPSITFSYKYFPHQLTNFKIISQGCSLGGLLIKLTKEYNFMLNFGCCGIRKREKCQNLNVQKSCPDLKIIGSMFLWWLSSKNHGHQGVGLVFFLFVNLKI